jgi:hypothetical protein
MSNNKQQTAVEWLVEKLDQNFDYVADTIIQQAKEMEKQQIKDAYKFGISDEYGIGSEQYYNETFGGKDII